jgi:uncharacterized protein YheU (UPF0270 family)
MSATCGHFEPCVGDHAERSESWVQEAVRLVTRLEERVREFVAAEGQDLGSIELELERQSQELFRAATEKAAQKKADAAPPLCPVCQKKLSRLSRNEPRTVQTRFGPVTLKRVRGYCKHCKKWRVPADTVLGLAEGGSSSPRLQEMAALLAAKMPVAQASQVMEHLTGVKMSRPTVHREAKRQGQRAQRLRRKLDAQAKSLTPTAHPELVLEPYQMIIQIDAWNIRERDGWGQTKKLRRRGQEPERWHWVYTGTCFRLDHRGQTEGGRPVISERGFVATREGIDGLRAQLQAEALRRGLGQAAGVLVIADGAVWIWRLADDRFPEARQRLDYYHAVQHLAAAGRAIFGQDEAALEQWLKPLRRQLKNESSVKVITHLEELLSSLPEGSSRKALAKEVHYFNEHRQRMDYRQARRRGEPIGSGAVESTCRQTQCRFKRPGQYWSSTGDEALLCLEMFWRNDRWSLLFPHRSATWSRN